MTEFKTDCGKHVRLEGNKIYILRDGAYVFDGVVDSKYKNIKKIWAEYTGQKASLDECKEYAKFLDKESKRVKFYFNPETQTLESKTGE